MRREKQRVDEIEWRLGINEADDAEEKPDLERRLEDVERKLDQVLKELEDSKGR